MYKNVNEIGDTTHWLALEKDTKMGVTARRL